MKNRAHKRVTNLERHVQGDDPPVEFETALSAANWRLLRGKATDDDYQVIIEERGFGLWVAALQHAEQLATEPEGRLRNGTDVGATIAKIVATPLGTETDPELFQHLKDLADEPRTASFESRRRTGMAQLWLRFLTSKMTQDLREMFTLRMGQYAERPYRYENWHGVKEERSI